MKKNETNNRIEVKATVTEVLDSETDIIYDGGVHRDIERENWKERREMLEKLGSRGGSRHTFLDRDDVDDVFPRQDHYIETTTRVRACYVMDGQTYEREVTLSGGSNWRLAGRKIYLTLDPAHPEEPLQASRYKSASPSSALLVCGMLVLLVIFSAAMLLLYYGQVL